MTFDWSKYAIGGATRPDGISGLQPEFREGLQAFLMAADEALGPGLQVYSGYRSPEVQAGLYESAVQKYGSPEAARKWVAPPGRSQHNRGAAADLKFNGLRLDQHPEAAAWVAQNAPQYGLAVPMSWEPWQVEMAGARGAQPTGNALAAPVTQGGDMDRLRTLNALAAMAPRYEAQPLEVYQMGTV